MATIDSKKIIDQIIANDGYYDLEDKDAPDNQRANRIVKYRNAWGGIGYGITFGNEPNDKYIFETEFIQQPEIIWDIK